MVRVFVSSEEKLIKEIKANCSKQAGDGDKKIILWAGPAAKNIVRQKRALSLFFPVTASIFYIQYVTFSYLDKLLPILLILTLQQAARGLNIHNNFTPQ